MTGRGGDRAAARGAAGMAWSALLDRDETLLWHGRPEPGLFLHPFHRPQLALGVGLVILAVIWRLALPAGPGPSGHEPAGAGLHLAWLPAITGAALALAAWLGPVIRLHHTRYALTDRRALIVYRWPLLPIRLRAFAITDETVIGYDPTAPSSVGFGFARAPWPPRRLRMVGFERIGDGPEVHALIRGLQTRDRRARQSDPPSG